MEEKSILRTSKGYSVIPSSFNWWGAWLRNNNDGIVLRPKNGMFKSFEIKNRDYWPNNWLSNLNSDLLCFF